MTVVVRDRNVVVTAVLEGDSGRGGYGPVSVSRCRPGRRRRPATCCPG